MRLTKVTGAVILGLWLRKTYIGTAEQLEVQYKKVRRHNLTVGWWSVPSVLLNPYALVRNALALHKLKRLVAELEARTSDAVLPPADDLDPKKFAKDFWDLATDTMNDVRVHCIALETFRDAGQSDEQIVAHIARALSRPQSYVQRVLDVTKALPPLYEPLALEQAHNLFVGDMFMGAYNIKNPSPEAAERLWREMLELYEGEPKLYRIEVEDEIFANGLLALGRDLAIALETYAWD